MSVRRRIKRSLHELRQHILHRAGLRRQPDYLIHADRQSRFSHIYETGIWSHGDKEIPSSGHGSSLKAAREVRKQLPAILTELGSRCLLDVGCGDLTWMRNLDLPCDYIGVDIVTSVIQTNILENKSHTSRFLVADGVTDSLPDADTVLCREVLFHLSFGDCIATLRNILAKPREFVILTTDRETIFNADIESGDFRVLNLEKRPFRLPPPMKAIPDNLIMPGRILGIWRAGQVRSALRR